MDYCTVLCCFSNGNRNEDRCIFRPWIKQIYPQLLASYVFAFTLIVFVADYKNIIKSVTVQLTCCYVFWAWLEAVFIYETGERELHGNWLWGYNAAMFILWGVSLIKFFEYARKYDASKCMNKIIVPLGITVFFVQVLCGIAYWYYLLMQ